MHKARAFFFVAAGIFLLALAYHLGAASAKAQATGTVEVAGIEPEGETFAGSSGRYIYRFHVSRGSGTSVGPVPGTSPIVAVSYSRGSYYAELANGDCYSNCGEGCASPLWVLMGNVFGGATPATRATWGEVKAKYRPGAPTQDK